MAPPAPWGASAPRGDNRSARRRCSFRRKREEDIGREDIGGQACDSAIQRRHELFNKRSPRKHASGDERMEVQRQGMTTCRLGKRFHQRSVVDRRVPATVPPITLARSSLKKKETANRGWITSGQDTIQVLKVGSPAS